MSHDGGGTMFVTPVLMLGAEPSDCENVLSSRPFDLCPKPPARIFNEMMRSWGSEHVLDASIYNVPGETLRVLFQI
jgi:hypothetical protein